MHGVDDQGPDVDIDRGGVSDDLEALLKPILQQGESHKQGVKETEHDNELQIKRNKIQNKPVQATTVLTKHK